jgi:hypothetical protein
LFAGNTTEMPRQSIIHELTAKICTWWLQQSMAKRMLLEVNTLRPVAKLSRMNSFFCPGLY